MADKESVALPKDLLDRARELAPQLGFDSVDDLLRHLLERVLQEVGESDAAEDKSATLDRLKDLGYL